jgi:serine/threonine-protein kinase
VLPFQGGDWYEIARQHVEDSPPRPRSLNPALSRGMERVILICLEKDASKRYATGDALHTELVQLLGRVSTPDDEATVVIPTPVGGVTTATAAGAPGRRRALRSLALASVTVLGILALLAGLRRARSHDTTTPAPPVTAMSPESGTAHAGVLVSTPTDTAVASTASVVPPVSPPARPELRIIAPRDAEVTVDGETVGHGNWRGTRFAAGEHRVVASVHTMDGCSSAVDSSRVKIPERGVAKVTLAPHPCGSLSIDAEPAGARWDLSSLDGTHVAEGQVPQGGTVLVPSGPYVLRVSKSFCADYRARIAIPSGVAHRERVRLICGQ